MTAVFISDLHLDEDAPELTALFLRFLRQGLEQAQALYILGDLFEAWIGDDHDSPLNREVIAALRALSERGMALFAMHGNRDFLLGAGFEQASRGRLLPDPCVVDLDGIPTLLMHGDLLCTDDMEYQRFRAQVRDPEAQRQFLSLPLPQRLAVAHRYREQSRMRTGGKPEAIMDANPRAIREAMREHGVTQLIHGHTHRPGIHYFHLGDHRGDRLARRIVLGDWGKRASVLTVEGGRYRLGMWPEIGPEMSQPGDRPARHPTDLSRSSPHAP